MKQKLTYDKMDAASGGSGGYKRVNIDAATAEKLNQNICPVCGHSLNKFVETCTMEPIAQCRGCRNEWVKNFVRPAILQSAGERLLRLCC